MKILITGGSGFIGTNLAKLCVSKGWQVLNLDVSAPKDLHQIDYWENVDILNGEILFQKISNYQPDYIVHLAARTDLNEVQSVDGYKVNIDGVRNVMEAAKTVYNLKRIIVASSMLVCKLGYSPKSFEDYMPDSLYGKSKVLTELIVKEYSLNWTVVRPTSIWGPWFGEPYKNFFDLVIRGLYFNIPKMHSSTKTYGYVNNTCHQILSLLVINNPGVNHNYFYLGDSKPLNITDWASRIRNLNSQSELITLPKWTLSCAAKLGDLLKLYLGINSFPMNSFRFRNMTNDNIIEDLDRTISLTGIGVDSNIDEQILETLNWLKQNNK